MQTEQMIVSALVSVKEFKQKALPYIEESHFETASARTFFKIVRDYDAKYRDVPKKSAFEVELANLKNISQETYDEVEALKEKAFSEKVQDELNKIKIDWLVDTTEKYCKERAVYNAVLESFNIISKESKKSEDAIPSLLQSALNVSFKPTLGHDYIRDWEKRFEMYHTKVDRIPTPLTMINKTTKGGFPKKSLCVPIAPTGVGKSLFLTFFSGWWLTQGYDVLYVTLEMAYDKIGERIDAALMDWSLEDLDKYPKDVFETKINQLKSKKLGRLVIEEYPTGTFSAMNLSALLDELESKENFKPQIVCVDYLGIMKAAGGSGNDNSYNYIKKIAEELRSIAMARNILVVAPHQTNRGGQGASDYDLTEIADSAGISMTADWIVGMISTEELEQLGHIRFKQLKNRHGPLSPKSYIVGVNRAKMQLYDVDIATTAPSSSPPVNTLNNLASAAAKTPAKSLTFD